MNDTASTPTGASDDPAPLECAPEATGHTFGGTARFAVRRRLGAGGMGVVFEAHDRERDSIVALKTLTRVNAPAIARLKSEFRLLADVLHPNLVRLHELFCEEGQWFFTMDVANGASFYDHVRPWPHPPAKVRRTQDVVTLGVESTTLLAEGPPLETFTVECEPVPLGRPSVPPTSSAPLNVGRLRSALIQLVAGVEAIHRSHRLHRDLKPGNVLVSDNGHLVILDFGIAAAFDNQAHDPIIASYIAGTPQYMAPEYFLDGAKSAAMDWYAVGVMLYQALVGHLPFGGKRILTQRLPRNPREVAPESPEDLSQLAMRLLEFRPEDRPSGAEILRTLGASDDVISVDSAPHRTSETTFVGREKETESLFAAARCCRDDHAIAVCIAGPAGGGKTALVERFLADISAADGAMVLQGRCYERESVPFKAFDELIDALVGLLRRFRGDDLAAVLPVEIMSLVRIFPAFARLGVPTYVPKDEELGDALQQRRVAFAAFRSLLGALAARRPLVISIDDLQWGDSDSAALLLYLLEHREAPAPLFVLGYRAEDAATSTVVRAIAEHRKLAPERLTTIALGPLSHDDSRRLASSLLREGRVDDEELTTHLAREASGNPLFLGELVRQAIALSIRAASGAATTGAATTGDASTLPPAVSLTGVLRSRVGQLQQDARRLLETVAIAGRPVSAQIAANAAGLGGVEADICIATLRAAKLLRSGGPRRADTLETFHDRVRETVSSDVEPRDSVRIHCALAGAMEREGADPEVLALHFRAGGEPRRAAGYAAKAAASAAATLAFDHAARLYRLAVDLAGEDGATEESSRVRTLREALGSALYNAGRGAEAAPELLRAAGDTTSVESIELRRRAAEAWLMTGQIDKGLTVVRDVLSKLGLRLYESSTEAAVALVYHRAKNRVLEHLPRGAASSDPFDRVRIEACVTMAWSFGLIDPVLAAAYSARGYGLAIRTGAPSSLALALDTEAAYQTMDGVFDARAEALFARGEAMNPGDRDAEVAAMRLVDLSVAMYQRGEWSSAAECASRAEQALLRDGRTRTWGAMNIARSVNIVSLHFSGRWKHVVERFAVLTKNAAERGDLTASTVIKVCVGPVVHIANDDAVSGRQELRAAIAQWPVAGFDWQRLWATWFDAWYDLYADEPIEAMRRLEALWKQFSRSLFGRNIGSLTSVGHLRADAAIAVAERTKGSERADALQIARREMARLKRANLGWATAHATQIGAALAHLEGDDAACVDELARASAAYDKADMALHAAFARRQRGRLLGGKEGATIVADSDAEIGLAGVKSPHRVARILTSGYQRTW